MTTITQPAAPPMAEGPYYRWMQLAMGIVCMAMIANLQYGWTLFVDPIDAKYHWGRAAIQLAFTLFVVTVIVPLLAARSLFMISFTVGVTELSFWYVICQSASYS